MHGTQLLLPGFEWSPVSPNSRKRVAVWVYCYCPVEHSPEKTTQEKSLTTNACGSRLFLSSPAFLSRVAAGCCPVRLSLSVFHWPVRSSVLLSLLRVLSSPRVFGALSSPEHRPVLCAFLPVAVRALGFSGVFSVSAAARFASDFAPVAVPSFRVLRVSLPAVLSAFASLSRCFGWLLRHGTFCPWSLRPALARLVCVVASLVS